MRVIVMTGSVILGEGWEEGDDIRVLIASGIGVSNYSINSIRSSMNRMSEYVTGKVRELLGLYDDASDRLSELNNSNEGKVLVKADVLEWAITGEGYSVYNVQLEIRRIRGIMSQYFSENELFNSEADITRLIRS